MITSKPLTLIATLCVAFCLFAALPANAQTTLLNTTFSAAVDNKTTVVPLTAVTSITAIGNPISLSSIGAGSGNALWVLYAGGEAMEVVSLSGLNVTVRRGRQGTTAQAHASGTKVLGGPVQAFVTKDPRGPCTRTQLTYVPVVNVLTGAANDCVASQWGNFTTNKQVGTVIASQAGSMTGAYAILAAITHISGTAAIVTIDVPPGLQDGQQFILIPDAAFTWTAAGNIVSTGTAVAGKAITFTWDRVAAKLYPSY